MSATPASDSDDDGGDVVNDTRCGYFSSRADRMSARRIRGLLCLSKRSFLDDGCVEFEEGWSADITRIRIMVYDIRYPLCL